MSRRELRQVMESGHPVDPNDLDDHVYHGVSLGLPGWVERLSWKTFAKTFHRDPQTGVLRGWNVRIQQAGVDGAYEPMHDKHGNTKTFGHYEVVSCEGHSCPMGSQGLLIHYGRGGNPRFDPGGLLRDPIVALSAGDASVLLGYSYIEVGPLRINTPSFFRLVRGPALGTGPFEVTHAPRRPIDG